MRNLICERTGQIRLHRKRRGVLSRKKKKWLPGFLLLTVLAMLFGGCRGRGEGVSNELVSPDETYGKTGSSAGDYHLEDKASLYKEQDDEEVVTMYLTVGKGNETDGTDHAWTEVNEYSLDYYEENNLEPYKCEAVLQAGDENGPVEGEFGYGERTANATVGLRGKGASAKPQKSYRINIKEGKGKWENQKAVILNKHAGDPLRFRNKLAYSLMQEIPWMISARTRFVHLYVKDKTEGENGLFRDYGLFTSVEQINRTYLKQHGFDGEGQLYKAENFDWERHEDSILLAADENFDAKEFERYLEIKGSGDHTKLCRLLDRVNDGTIPVRETVEQCFDKENLFYWMAFHILTGNGDVGNYYLYSPQALDRWYLISWDNDKIFDEGYEKLKDENYSPSRKQGIFTFVNASLYRRILKDKSCRAELTEAVETLKNSYLTREKITEKAEAFQKLVKPYVYRLPDKMYAGVTAENYDILVEGIAQEAEQNYAAFLKSMEQPWPFHILEPQKKGSALFLRWGESYVFQEQELTYSLELAQSPSFTEKLVYEEALKETQYKLDLPSPGQYFIRVRAQAGKENTQDACEYYLTEQGRRIDGTQCFYVLEDGSVALSVYEEE